MFHSSNNFPLILLIHISYHSFQYLQHVGPCKIRAKGYRETFPKLAILTAALQDNNNNSNCYHCKSLAFKEFQCQSHDKGQQNFEECMKVNFLSVIREKDKSGTFYTEFYGSSETNECKNPKSIGKQDLHYLPNGQGTDANSDERPINGRQKAARFGEERHKEMRENCKNEPMLQFLLDCLLKDDYKNTTVSKGISKMT